MLSTNAVKTATESRSSTPRRSRKAPGSPHPGPWQRELQKHKWLAYVSLVALILQSSILFLAFFEPPLPYKIPGADGLDIQSEHFRRALTALTGGSLSANNLVRDLPSGERFYAAELAAIAAAKRMVHIECYIFHRGEVTRRFLQALEERAAAGVDVKVLIDAVGSTRLLDSNFDKLRKAHGRAAWYHPLRWYNWPRLNNRTHRELIVIDGAVGFVGGAGFDDQWLSSSKDPRWRDTMVRVDGEAANGLEATFSQNWLESTGEVLLAPKYFQPVIGTGSTPILVVASSPTVGRGTSARVLIQALIAASHRQLHITSPYFLPDRSLTEDIRRVVREHHVEVKVIVPGKKNDHMLTRRSSRRLYGEMFKAGARIFEYRPSMIHAKVLLVDGLWTVVGSTNMDSRSFGLNDEVNVAMFDPVVAQHLEQDFQNDLTQSSEVSYEQWKRRPWYERVQEWFGSLIERQQ
jgi:cardiolipin synthase A/B